MRRLPLLTLLITIGCNGMIDDAPGETLVPNPPTVEPPPTAEECATREPTAASQLMRRLTRGQYENLFRDALGLAELPAAVQARLMTISEGRSGGFASTDTAASEEDVRGFLSMAEGLARATIEEGLGEPLAGCSLDVEPACAGEVIEVLGPRLLRRPFLEGELASYVSLAEEFAGDGPAIAAETALLALYASPSLIYQAEPIERVEGEVGHLDPFALANRLSFFLWNSGPDDELIAAAQRGELADPEAIGAQVERMIADPKSRRQAEVFYEQYLMLNRIDDAAPDDPAWEAGLRDKTIAEVYEFVDQVMRDTGSFEDLLTADFTFGDEELAGLYGAAPPDADGRIQLDPAERSGLLTSAAMMAALSRQPEIFRGEFVRGNLLCDLPPPPPPGALEEVVEDRLITQPCAGCHMAMDPIGFGFAAYDSMGRFNADRAQGGEILNGSGSITDPAIVGAFDSPRELGERASQSPFVQDCFSDQWLRFGLGRAESAEDQCSQLGVREMFRESGGDVRALIRAITLASSFQTRAASDLTPGEE